VVDVAEADLRAITRSVPCPICNDVSLPLTSYADLPASGRNSGHRWRPAIRKTGFMEFQPAGGRFYPALILAARITLPHFSVSSAMNVPN